MLKEEGKIAQSDKWMWLTRGGPPGQQSVLFEYDPSRGGRVPVRLLDDFTGILQADGYSGYGAICRQNKLIRIGCWDHALRRFVEISKSDDKKPHKGHTPLADVAISKIDVLYRIERKLKNATEAQRLHVRQEKSLPLLNEFKAWLESKQGKVMKDSLLYKAIRYCLNQWEHLVGYCQRGDLQISNILAENAIRPLAIGRRNWLFADTSKGASASAAWYSLIETAKTHDLNPQAYIQHVLENIGTADTVEKLEQLLAWNVKLDEPAQVRTSQPS